MTETNPSVPRIECGNCGTSHHIDAAAGEYQGHCRECWAYLRRPTSEEQKQFAEFMQWKTIQMENDEL